MTAANWLLLGGFSLRLGPFRAVAAAASAGPSSGSRSPWPCGGSSDGGPRPLRGLGWLRRLGWPSARATMSALTLVGVIASFGPRLALGPALRAPAALRAALRARPRLRRAPGPGPLRRPGHDGPRGPGRIRRRRPRAPASPSRVADRGARRRSAALAALETWAVPLPLMSVAPRPGARRPVARRPAAAPRRSSCCRCTSRALMHLESLPAPRLDRALAPARQRLRWRVPARLCRGRQHAEHVPGPGRRRPAPDDPRPLRGRAPRPVPPGAAGASRGGAGAPARGRHAGRGLRAHPDLRDRPRGRAGVRRARVVRTKARARSSTARHPPGRPPRARRSTRRS